MRRRKYSPAQRGAEPLAFDAQKGDFVERIDHAQARIELQAIDNPHRVAEADVLGAQIAVAVDDAARAHPRIEKRAAFGQKPALHRIDVTDRPGRQREAGVEENAAIIGEALPSAAACAAGEMRTALARR